MKDYVVEISKSSLIYIKVLAKSEEEAKKLAVCGEGKTLRKSSEDEINVLSDRKAKFVLWKTEGRGSLKAKESE